MKLVLRSLVLEVQKTFASPTLIVLLLSPLGTAGILFWMFPGSNELVSLFLLFNTYIITVMNTSLSIVHERERGTLTALAVTPVDLQLILWTKAWVAMGFALATSAAVAALAALTAGTVPLLWPERLPGVAGVVLMSGLLFAAVAVLISTYSATVKQVEQVGTGAVMGLLLLLMLPAERLAAGGHGLLAWAPVLNARQMLGALSDPGAAAWSTGAWTPLAVHLAIGTLLLALAIRIFKHRFLQ